MVSDDIIVDDAIEPGATQRLQRAEGGVAPSTSRRGPDRRGSVERTNSGDSRECGNETVPAEVT